MLRQLHLCLTFYICLLFILIQEYGSVENRTLVIFTDGGSEHRVNLESVKIPLILMFKHLKLGLLVALRTAPNNSWLNYVERCMSTLNLGLQNVSLTRYLRIILSRLFSYKFVSQVYCSVARIVKFFFCVNITYA